MKNVVTPYVLFLSMKTHKGMPEVLASHPPKGICLQGVGGLAA